MAYSVSTLARATCIAVCCWLANPSPCQAEPIQRSASGAESPTDAPTKTRPNKGLLVGGLATFGVSYGLSLAVSTIYFVGVYPIPAAICEAANPGECSPQAAPAWLLLPVAGPFLAAHSLDSDPGDDEITMFEDTNGNRTLFYVDGALQALGAGLFAAAFVFPEEVERERSATNRVRITPQPMAVPAGAGVGVRIDNLL